MTDSLPSELLVHWTTGDKTTALNMVFMYTINCRVKGWWDEATLLIWGASTELAAKDDDIKAKIAEALDAGVKVLACKACAENLNVVEKLKEQGIKVFYVGQFMTEWLQSGKRVLSI